MARQRAPKVSPKPAPKPVQAKPASYLPWPTSEKELCPRSRTYRIHRINAYEWQAYVTDQGAEFPIGKPDLIDMVVTRMKGVMRAEGQAEFMAAKAAATKVVKKLDGIDAQQP